MRLDPAISEEGEARRLAALHELNVLDTPPEPVFDDIVLLAAQICATPIALVSLVDADRQWLKARLGPMHPEIARELSICAHAITSRAPLFVVEDTALDLRFRANPLVTDAPRMRSYAGAPIVLLGGHAVGTVCVIDTVPRVLHAAQRAALRALARQAAALLEARRQTLESEQRLLTHESTERQRSEQALLLSEQRLSLALSRSRLAMFDWDIAADRVFRGPNLSTMRGGPALEIACGIADVRALMHPADVPGVDAAMRAAFKGDAPAYDFEHRIRRLDGEWIWIHAVGRVTERDAAGRALRISGTDEDVSARKAAELAAFDSQRRLRTIADNLPAIVAHIDTAERYVFLNAHVQRVFGLDPGAALGKTMREVRGEATYAALAPHVAKALRGETVSFSYRDQVDGQARDYQSTYVPDVDASGEVQGFLAMTFDITELQETQRRLELLARVDTLTGLPNRRQLDERLVEAMARTRRARRAMAVMFLDIDAFKAVNDALGHAGGDAVLCEFARRLKDCVRATDLVARLAGDEFVVVLEGIDDPAELGRLAEKVVACIRPPFESVRAPLRVTTSLGAALYSGGAQTAPELLALADAALYQAKTQGRDRCALA